MLGVADLTKSLKDGAKNIFKDVTNSGFRIHSGACDVLIVRHKDGLRSSQWHIHLGRDISVQMEQALLCLELGGAVTGLSMSIDDDKRGVFKDTAAALRPSPEQLQALPLKSGYNEACFLVQQLDPADSTWSFRGKIPLGVFLWDASDKIVVVDVEGVVVKGDIWTKSVDVMMATNKSSQPLENVRDGVGPLFSYFDRAGYRLLLLRAAPITRADRVREIINSIRQSEVEQWGRGAAVPASPIITTQSRMGTHLWRRAQDKTIGKLTGSDACRDFKSAALEEISQLFAHDTVAQEGEVGGEGAASQRFPETEDVSEGKCRRRMGEVVFCGGLSPSVEDAKVYVEAGVPKERIFIVDSAGCVLPYTPDNSHHTWASYVDMYPHLQRLFPKVSRVAREGGGR